MVAEGGGFEPPEAHASPVFKTGAIVRSANPPEAAEPTPPTTIAGDGADHRPLGSGRNVSDTTVVATRDEAPRSWGSLVTGGGGPSGPLVDPVVHDAGTDP
jgi:hypothetical protein